MPKDEWRRATMRARYGPTRYTGKRKKRKRKKRGGSASPAPGQFLIPALCPCAVRHVNSTEWKSWRTSKAQLLPRLNVEGVNFIFRVGEWLLRIDGALCRTKGKAEKAKADQPVSLEVARPSKMTKVKCPQCGGVVHTKELLKAGEVCGACELEHRDSCSARPSEAILMMDQHLDSIARESR